MLAVGGGSGCPVGNAALCERAGRRRVETPSRDSAPAAAGPPPPQIGQAEIDVELEEIDSGGLSEHAARVGRASDGVGAAAPVRERTTGTPDPRGLPNSRDTTDYASSARTVNGSVQSSREPPSIVSRHS